MTSVITRSGARSRRGVPGRLAVGDGLDLVAGLGQEPAHVLAHVGVVVGEQDPRARPLRSLRWPRPRPTRASCRRGGRRSPSGPGASAAPPRRRPGDPRRRRWARGRATSRSAGRCAEPRGIVTVKVLPRPTSLSTRDRAAVQPDQLLHQRQPDAAALVASAPCAPFTRWKRSNRRGSSSAGMPVPVSRTSSATASPAGAQRAPRSRPRR